MTWNIFWQAVLSIQLAITLVVASVMSRVGPFFSFARWLLTRGAGLVRYVHPDDDELRQLANLPPRKYVNPETNGSSSKGGRRGRNHNQQQQQHQANGAGDVFNVPKSIDLQLDKADISVHDIVQLRFYTEYQEGVSTGVMFYGEKSIRTVTVQILKMEGFGNSACQNSVEIHYSGYSTFASTVS